MPERLHARLLRAVLCAMSDGSVPQSLLPSDDTVAHGILARGGGTAFAGAVLRCSICRSTGQPRLVADVRTTVQPSGAHSRSAAGDDCDAMLIDAEPVDARALMRDIFGYVQ